MKYGKRYVSINQIKQTQESNVYVFDKSGRPMLASANPITNVEPTGWFISLEDLFLTTLNHEECYCRIDGEFSSEPRSQFDAFSVRDSEGECFDINKVFDYRRPGCGDEDDYSYKYDMLRHRSSIHYYSSCMFIDVVSFVPSEVVSRISEFGFDQIPGCRLLEFPARSYNPPATVCDKKESYTMDQIDAAMRDEGVINSIRARVAGRLNPSKRKTIIITYRVLDCNNEYCYRAETISPDDRYYSELACVEVGDDLTSVVKARYGGVSKVREVVEVATY